MKQCINTTSKRQKQWLWFIGLWCGGAGSMLVLSFFIKLLMGI